MMCRLAGALDAAKGPMLRNVWDDMYYIAT